METRSISNALYQEILEGEAMCAGRCATEELRKHYINMLALTNGQLAVCAMRLDQDHQLARMRFSNAAIALEFNQLKYESTIFYSSRNFCFAVLSDNSRAIQRCLELKASHQDLGVGMGRAFQAVLTDDSLALENAIALIEKNTRKKTWEKHFAGAVSAFTGLLKQDEALVEKGIRELLAAHKRQQQPVVLRDHFNIEATAFAKLAFRQGMLLDIPDPLLPRELVPVQECPAYPGYAFFQEIGY